MSHASAPAPTRLCERCLTVRVFPCIVVALAPDPVKQHGCGNAVTLFFG